jgi:hypothetical protein
VTTRCPVTSRAHRSTRRLRRPFLSSYQPSGNLQTFAKWRSRSRYHSTFSPWSTEYLLSILSFIGSELPRLWISFGHWFCRFTLVFHHSLCQEWHFVQARSPYSFPIFISCFQCPLKLSWSPLRLLSDMRARTPRWVEIGT